MEIFNQIENETPDSIENKVIFILGLPRSGTSLVEQIITSHSQVFGGGELPILSNIIKKNFIKNERINFENLNENLKKKELLNNLRDEYNNYINFLNLRKNI